MIIALAALNAALAAALIAGGWLVLRHLERRDRLERDERARDARERDAAECRHAAQIETLLQRIQAPEVAIIQHQQDTGTPGDAVLPLTDEESAAREEERRLVIQRIEELENGALGEMIGG